MVSVIVLMAGMMAGELDGLSPSNSLPTIQGETLGGHKITLPLAAQGKVTFLALGFSRESGDTVEAFVKRFRQEFSSDEGVTFYQVPMIGGAGRMAKMFIDRGMRKGTAKEMWENVVTVYDGVDVWKQRMRVRNVNEAYLILMDKEARISWMGHGMFGEDLYGQLRAATKKLR